MFFDSVAEGAPDPIFGLAASFRNDPRPHKIDLMVGIYKNEELKSELIPAVKKGKEGVFSEDLMADYLPIDGMAEFIQDIGALAFGTSLWKEIQERVYGAQTVGGTGALRIGGEFLVQEVTKSFAISQPTWPNHRSIFEKAGGQVHNYAYYNRETHGFDFELLRSSWLKLPEKTVVILHTTCHNPTGCDPTAEEWNELSSLCKQKKLIPFFDFAYQGFGDGLEEDRLPIEIFIRDGHEILVAYSCSKNLSLYCQRVGALFVVGKENGAKGRIGSQIKRIIRTLYSNPPAHGAKVAHLVFKHFRSEWEKELEMMRQRMSDMRILLADHLAQKTEQFEFIRKHKGMFSFMDLDKIQVQKLKDEYAIYLIESGRISVAGLNRKNMARVAEALIAVSG